MAAGPADERRISDLIVDQVEFASLLLLNKCDLVCPVRPSSMPYQQPCNAPTCMLPYQDVPSKAALSLGHSVPLA